MAVLKVLASISLIAFAIAAQPALAANDGQSSPSAPSTTTPSDSATQPRAHRAKLSPEERAARRALRQQQHQSGSPPTSTP